jgi:hypothetical protein
LIAAKSQRYPIQIKIDDGDDIVHIQNVWITNSFYSYYSNDLIVCDCIDFEAETVSIDASLTFA